MKTVCAMAQPESAVVYSTACSVTVGVHSLAGCVLCNDWFCTDLPGGFCFCSDTEPGYLTALGLSAGRIT